MRATSLILDLTGAGLLGYGAWLAWPPAGFMVGGTLCILTSLALHRSAVESSS